MVIEGIPEYIYNFMAEISLRLEKANILMAIITTCH